MRMWPARVTAAAAWMVAASLAAFAVSMAWPRSLSDPSSAGLARSLWIAFCASMASVIAFSAAVYSGTIARSVSMPCLHGLVGGGATAVVELLDGLIRRRADPPDLRRFVEQEVSPGRRPRILERRCRLVDESLDVLVVAQVGEGHRVHDDVDAARPFRLDLVELAEQRENFDLLRADLAERRTYSGNRFCRALKRSRSAWIDRSGFERRQPGAAVGGDLLQVAQELVDLARRPRHAEIAADHLHPLQHHLGVDALDHDGLLPIGSGGQPLDRIAGDVLVDDQRRDQSDTDADSRCRAWSRYEVAGIRWEMRIHSPPDPADTIG